MQSSANARMAAHAAGDGAASCQGRSTKKTMGRTNTEVAVTCPAAVVIGGTSLAGGRASIVGTFLGVLTFALIFSLMTQLNMSTEIQQVTKGLIVLGAVLLQRPEARY